MADISHIGDQFGTTVDPRILEQYKDSVRWKACLKAVIDKMQTVEDASFELAHVLDFRTDMPTGGRLDWLAGLVNVKRFNGESDVDLFGRFVARLGDNTAGTPDNIIYNSAIMSGDSRPAYLDEADATFFVYTGARPVEPGSETWEEGGRQLSRAQVRKMAPAGVLGLPGAAILDADGNYLTDAQGRLLLAVADDSTIEREVLLADNNGAIVVTPQSVPVRVVLRGPSVPSIPTITTDWNGVPVDAVRIKDLPASGDTNGYFVRDSDTEGTVNSRAMTEETLDDLWDTTPAEGN
ncbi:MAG: hypothetical protein IKS96_07325 [Fibrobacter sp.]|nr:hypothetical protein [Fibrobacter sp.]MBR6449739.1 hypothetical protein [Fibrobacter sp.]